MEREIKKINAILDVLQRGTVKKSYVAPEGLEKIHGPHVQEVSIFTPEEVEEIKKALLIEVRNLK